MAPSPTVASPSLRTRADLARREADWPALIEIGGRLEKLGDFEPAWAALADAAVIRQPPECPEWHGSALMGQKLLVERRIRHVGAELRMARFLALAAEQGARVTAHVDPRLVDLFQRSFPAVDVRDRTPSGNRARTEGALGASYERLAQWLGADAESIQRGFRPLVADPDRRAAWRAEQSATTKPLVGLAWHSTNQRKDLPSLSDWAFLLSSVAGAVTWQSLQYDEAAAGLADLSQRARCEVGNSRELDQLTDLDGFAAQVDAVDLIVTISNTTAHMAGALRKPCIVILDDQDHLSWPEGGSCTPFYPNTLILRRCRRPWVTVMRDVSEAVSQHLSHL